MSGMNTVIYTPQTDNELNAALLDPLSRKSGNTFERHIRVPAFASDGRVLRVQGPQSGPALHVLLGGQDVELELCGGNIVVVL